jgi:hypothetical protein
MVREAKEQARIKLASQGGGIGENRTCAKLSGSLS